MGACASAEPALVECTAMANSNSGPLFGASGHPNFGKVKEVEILMYLRLGLKACSPAQQEIPPAATQVLAPFGLKDLWS